MIYGETMQNMTAMSLLHASTTNRTDEDFTPETALQQILAITPTRPLPDPANLEG